MRFFGAVLCCALWGLVSAQDYANNEAIQLFQQYLQINTTTTNNLDEAVAFWQTQADSVGVELTKLQFEEGYPVLVMKWPGTNTSLGSIMLNSHMDVVPADESEGWTYPPFAGTLDDNGVIWGRGTQDMKSVSIQYFEALKQIKANGTQLLRNVYMTLMPDEENGGQHGMIPFLKSDSFKQMNVALELDEGAASGNLPLSPLIYQDKVPWQIQIDCYGVAEHSSSFPRASAAVQCANMLDKLMSFRSREYLRYIATGAELNAGAWTDVNVNRFGGGTATNIIPAHVYFVADIRLATNVNADEFDARLRRWVKESGDNVTMTYILSDVGHPPQSPATVITLANPFWTTLSSSTLSRGLAVLPLVSPGATDGRHVRDAGIPAFGFSPMPNTERLLHAVNEHLSADVFLNGISTYRTLIQNLANIPASQTSADPSVYLRTTAS